MFKIAPTPAHTLVHLTPTQSAPSPSPPLRRPSSTPAPTLTTKKNQALKLGSFPKFHYSLSAAIPLKLKGLAVGAGNYGRVALVSANLNSVKTAKVLAAAMVLTVVYSTFY